VRFANKAAAANSAIHNNTQINRILISDEKVGEFNFEKKQKKCEQKFGRRVPCPAGK